MGEMSSLLNVLQASSNPERPLFALKYPGTHNHNPQNAKLLDTNNVQALVLAVIITYPRSDHAVLPAATEEAAVLQRSLGHSVNLPKMASSR